MSRFSGVELERLDRLARRHLMRRSRAFHINLSVLLRRSEMAAMPRRRRGSLIEVLARAIVGQQVSAKVAATFWRRLQTAQGERALADFLVPKNQFVIRGCGLSNSKVRFLIGLGEARREGELSARRVNGLEHGERVEYLTRLDGIGVWTADMVGIFYCGDADIWPAGDLAVRRTFARLARIDEARTREEVAVFAPYRTYLALHMWREKNNPILRD